jgi:hypothetical protein
MAQAIHAIRDGVPMTADSMWEELMAYHHLLHHEYNRLAEEKKHSTTTGGAPMSRASGDNPCPTTTPRCPNTPWWTKDTCDNLGCNTCLTPRDMTFQRVSSHYSLLRWVGGLIGDLYCGCWIGGGGRGRGVGSISIYIYYRNQTLGMATNRTRVQPTHRLDRASTRTTHDSLSRFHFNEKTL